MAELRYDGLVVLVTGAGAGLGRQYALDFASRGASVVVNDLGGSTAGDGRSATPADQVVEEIRRQGGKAVANYDSVEFGDKLVKTAIDNYGKIDIVINNAGILRDRSFINMTEQDWDIIQKVHMKGAFSVTKAAWPYMKQNKFGRIIFTASPSGLYGNFGQANYSAAKLGLLGFCNTLSVEGQRYDIKCNTIAPTASSRLTQTVLPPELHEHLKPEYISPLVLYLSHPESEETGGVFEIAGGWIAKLRWQRSTGAMLRRKAGTMTPEMVRDHFTTITDFSSSTYPTDIRTDSAAHIASIMEDLDNQPADQDRPSTAKQHKYKPLVYEYSEKDVKSYALSVGAEPTPDEMRFVYEQDENFSVLPTYTVIPAFESLHEFITNPPPGIDVNLSGLLHGEHYTEVFKPLATAGQLRNEGQVVDVMDKGSGAVVILDVNSYDQEGDLAAYNQFVVFLKGSGGFGGKKSSSLQKKLVKMPERPADRSVEERIPKNRAALYRLNGDLNPMHIDPGFANMSGFEEPILHGLCTYAMAVRHVLRTYAESDVSKFKAVKARFSKPVFCGHTIRTEMWREGNRIHFICKNLDKGTICLEGGYVELHDVTSPRDDAISTDEALASDQIFEEVRRRLSLDPAIAEKINAVFLWNILKNDVVRAKWTVDLRQGGSVYKGEPKTGKVACTLTVSDGDMIDLAAGKLNPQKAFMSGKVKIRGNIGLVQKVDRLFRDHSKL